MAKASDCGSEDRGFESHYPPQIRVHRISCERVFSYSEKASANRCFRTDQSFCTGRRIRRVQNFHTGRCIRQSENRAGSQYRFGSAEWCENPGSVLRNGVKSKLGPSEAAKPASVPGKGSGPVENSVPIFSEWKILPSGEKIPALPMRTEPPAREFPAIHSPVRKNTGNSGKPVRTSGTAHGSIWNFVWKMLPEGGKRGRYLPLRISDVSY